METYGSMNMEVSPIFMIGMLAVAVVMIAAQWVIFSKAGKPGWYSLIPILNIVAFVNIAGKPWYWILGLFVPFVSIIVAVLLLHGLSENFGHGAGFTLGLFFLSPIFILILAFGDSEYIGDRKAKFA